MAKQNKSVVISTRFAAGELAAVAEAAADHGRTLSAYIRDMVLCAELRSRPGARIVRAPNGAEITVWSNHPDLLAVS